jgi:hypothetical protein
MNFFKNFRLLKSVKSEVAEPAIIPASAFNYEVVSEKLKPLLPVIPKKEPAKSAYEIARDAAEAADEARSREIYEGMQARARKVQEREKEDAAQLEKNVNFEYSFGENGKPNSLGANGVVFTGTGKKGVY